MKRPPPPATEDAPSSTLLSKPKLAAMQGALVASILGTARHFHQYLWSEDHRHPAYHAMFEAISQNPDPEIQGMLYRFGDISPAAFEKLLAKAEKRLRADVKLYLDIHHDYSLIIPQARLIEFPHGYPAAMADIPLYNAILHLFAATRLASAEAQLDDDHTARTVEGLSPETDYYIRRVQNFEDESSLTRFVNALLPVGKHFNPSGQLQLRH